MFPELLRIGPISIKTYGFFVAVGFLAGINYAKFLARKESIKPEIILDLSLYIIVSGLIGARILYVLLNWDFYRKNLIEIFFIWSGGLVLYGGII
ncbi:MAG: prolipoprotein diacylglyceryl transferase, partial [Endomicrobiia bacterium]